ncbi:hypothetical protein H8356DRAFT_279606 [Neocallimastix lanati (nom. inval.)]|nr:hypothetical protein H8356DRAFT_279606 [Neocallimastix sp. JGI-2020a]
MDCPDLIVLGSTQLTQRYFNGDTLNLNKYFNKYFIKTGNSFENILFKYAFYDYRIDNNWLAVPIIIDYRTITFNMTTFNYCIKKGYNLHYPPPYSDYWGSDYKKTWTWEKIFEYAGIISKCIGYPGFNLYRYSNNEVLKFFVSLCNALNIPFISENDKLKTKTCGFRGAEYIKKLKILKDIVENNYMEKPVTDQITYIKRQNDDNESNFIYSKELNGLSFFPTLYTKYDDVKNTFIPGSSFLGGSGIIITKKSKYPDEAFEFIEILINENYSFITDINKNMITPYENIPSQHCIKSKINQNNNISKKENCNSLLRINGTYPYYYIYNNITNIVYISHISINSERGISIVTNNKLNYENINILFQNKNYTCENKVDYDKNYITYYDKYKIEIPINYNETIILKLMEDNINNIHDQNIEIECQICEDTLKKSKPLQFPFSNFYEIGNLEKDSPIQHFFERLFNFKNSNETFEDIINYTCDDIEKSLFPKCQYQSDIIFEFAKCDSKIKKKLIIYKNCIFEENSKLPKYEDCFYTPYTNKNGLILGISKQKRAMRL